MFVTWAVPIGLGVWWTVRPGGGSGRERTGGDTPARPHRVEQRPALTAPAAERAPERTERRRSRGRLLLALGFFVVTTLLWFAPLLPDFATEVPGRASDGTSGLRYHWAAEQHGLTPFELGPDALVGAPEGSGGDVGLGAVGPIQPAFLMLLDDLLGVVPAWNLFILLGFVLSGLLTFGMLDRLGFTFAAALFGGYVVAFNSWQFEKAIEGHGKLVQVWVLSLVLWALVVMRARGGVRSAAAAGGGLAVVFLVSPYLFLLACTIVAVFGAVHTLMPPAERPHRRCVAEVTAVFGVGAVLVAPIALVIAKVSDIESLDRHVQELQAFGAAPLAYVVPSERHPVFGSAVAGLWDAADPRHFAEPTLFFGYTTMLLALVTVGGFVRRRGRFGGERRFVLAVGAGLVAVGFYASLPRLVDLGPVSLPTPAYAIGEITTLWRVYSRFAVVVCFGLVILASFTVQAFTQRRRWLLLPLLGVAAFEMAAGAPIQTWSTEPPEHVRWLATQPFGIVANYPMLTDDPAETRMQSEEYFHQTAHGLPLYAAFGGSRIDLGAQVVRALSKDLADPATPSVLAARSVRYVVVHSAVYRALGEEVPRVPRDRLRPVFSSGDTTVYVVEAKPAALRPLIVGRRAEIAAALGASAPRVGVGSGFVTSTPFADVLVWQRLVQDGIVLVENPQQSGPWEFLLRTEAFSPRVRRDIVLTGPDRRVLGRSAVDRRRELLAFGPFPLPAGRSVLRLHVEPGPGAFGSRGKVGLLLTWPWLQPVLDVDSVDVPERVSTGHLARFGAQRSQDLR